METSYRFEPCFPEAMSNQILDLVASVSRKSAGLGARLDRRTARSLADLVRIMSSYYSNLIEGHNTLPREIEAALKDEFSHDSERRNLQLEARIHVRLQEAIDRKFAEQTLPDPASVEFLTWVHREFYKDLPSEFRHIRSTTRTLDVDPGRMREAPGEEIAVGRHIPPSPAHVSQFMRHFEARFSFGKLGEGERIIAIASAHHRFNYIHPFIDGNGRVSRLMSHAMALCAGIGAHGLWSISRGLSRGLSSRKEYKAMMEHADTPRQGDLDGRGNLSERALADFIVWFLKVIDDQLDFMDELYDLKGLTARLKRLAEIKWRPEVAPLLVQVLHRGEMPRGEASHVTGLGTRTSSGLIQTLVRDGILDSETPKGPVFLRFKADYADVLFPRLFPES
jgi:Fic family protein